MKLLIVALIFAASCLAQSVSNIQFDGVGDSSVRVIFDVSTSYDTMQVRYGTSSCSGGSGGTIQTNGTAPRTFVLYAMTADLSGLAPSTTYHVCPEVKLGAGAFSTGADATFTTTARSQVLPLPPLAVSTTFPAQTGSTLNVLADCSNFQTQINQANTDQGIGLSDTIVIPAGTQCTGAYAPPLAADAVTFSGVVTSTSQITVASTAAFTENGAVVLSHGGLPWYDTSNYLPGDQIIPQGLLSDLSGGWRKGVRYYSHIVDGTHLVILSSPGGSAAIPGWVHFTATVSGSTITMKPTVETAVSIINGDTGGFATITNGSHSIPANTKVQFVTTGTLPGGLSADTDYYLLTAYSSNQNGAYTTQVSLTSGGSPVTITNTGSGTHTVVDQGLGTMYIANAPTQAGPWVVIRTGGTVPAAGTRIDNTTDAQLFQMQNAVPIVATSVFSTGILSHNWRLVGALFNTGTNSDYLTSTDPRPYCVGPTTYPDSSFIIFARARLQGPGYPNRTGCLGGASSMNIDGYNVGFIDSDLRGMDFWHPWYSGLVAARVSGTQMTLSPGTFHGGAFTSTTTAIGGVTLTGGSATGTAIGYFAMDGSMKVVAPTGTTGSCASPPISCSLSTSASPTYPVDANGRTAAGKVFTITLTGGSITGVAQSDAVTALNPFVTEGSNTIIAGRGPGPYVFSDNYFSGTGLNLHFDDGGGPFSIRGDYTITRNTFNVPASQFVTGPSSDGLMYKNRQPIEWKGGQRALVDGNIFQGTFDEVNPVSVSLALTPRSGGYITDFKISNNTFSSAAGGVNTTAPIDSYSPVSKPGARMQITNNLFQSLNGWTQTVAGANPRGWVTYGGYASEDLTLNHNTVYDNRGGNAEAFHWLESPAGGVSVKDNVFFYTSNGGLFVPENIANCSNSFRDAASWQCAWTSGPGNASYSFDHNVIVPSWSDTSVPSGMVATATVQSALGTDLGANFVPAGASQPANVALVHFVGNCFLSVANCALDPSSPYHNAASDATDIGVNLPALLAAQGGGGGTPVTGNGALISGTSRTPGVGLVH